MITLLRVALGLLLVAALPVWGVALTDPSADSSRAGWKDDLRPLPAEAWDPDRARHLLERAGFGGTPEEVAELAALPHAEAVRSLVRWQQAPATPLPAFKPSGVFPDEAFVPPIEGEMDAVFLRAFVLGNSLGVDLDRDFDEPWLQPLMDRLFYLIFADALETNRLAHWQGERMLRTGRPFEEKMALFWHGHFATESEKVRDYRKMAAQWELYREHGNGSFRDLLLGICRDPAMLIYLDGAQNVRGEPNENFAREVLELFTLGPGSYTEKDIQEAARAFTGWGLDDNAFELRRWKHDYGKKTVLGRTGRLDGEDVVDAILARPEAAHFLTGKLYRHFAREDLSPATQAALAAQLREGGYQIAPVMETIFLSRDFYSEATLGGHVKSPVELVVSTYRKLGLEQLPGFPIFSITTKDLGQGLYQPPNVAGWQGGRTWINPSTLTGRQNFARHALFPNELPLPQQSLHAIIVTGALDQAEYDEMKRLDEAGQRGRRMAAPERGAGANVDDQGWFDLSWAIYVGAEQAVGRVRFDGAPVVPFSVSSLLREAGVVDTAGAVQQVETRFFTVPLDEAQRVALAEALQQRLGSATIPWEREGLEHELRQWLHLVLSLPEYQLS